MRDAGRRVCTLCEDFGIRVAGTAALQQIPVPIHVLQLCGKFSSLLNPPHKQAVWQNCDRNGEVQHWSTSVSFLCVGLTQFCWSRNWVVYIWLSFSYPPFVYYWPRSQVLHCSLITHSFDQYRSRRCAFFPQLTECSTFIYCCRQWERTWREYHWRCVSLEDPSLNIHIMMSVWFFFKLGFMRCLSSVHY